ncbi:hypothetical protein WJX75_003052 [Coccomyxa subellipsoidea]|uniref:Uncharacterized protein n=1 Tax=Coccomyxa subellipsoidea TaxID=248742 RepID=A0ABR2YBS1_9CHLO
MQRRSGAIIASTSAFVATTKEAVLQLTRCSALDLGLHEIRVMMSARIDPYRWDSTPCGQCRKVHGGLASGDDSAPHTETYGVAGGGRVCGGVPGI